jgi:hypothetical protein
MVNVATGVGAFDQSLKRAGAPLWIELSRSRKVYRRRRRWWKSEKKE